MSSAYAVFSPTLVDRRSEDRSYEPRSEPPPDSAQPHGQPDDVVDANHLSPFYSSQAHQSSTSASPILKNIHTPADSFASLSVQYQSSDLGEVDDDPFFGADFSNPDGGTPSFLDEQLLPFSQPSEPIEDLSTVFLQGLSHNAPVSRPHHPLSPDQTPSLHGTSPQADGQQSKPTAIGSVLYSVSPQQLSKQPKLAETHRSFSGDVSRMTPETSGSNRSSEDGLLPTDAPLPPHNPQVSVSLWNRDGATSAAGQSRAVEPQAEPDNQSPRTVRGGVSAEDSGLTSGPAPSMAMSEARDEQGRRMPNPSTGSRGIGPDRRPDTFVPSVNELAAQRLQDERNKEVGEWLLRSDTIPLPPDAPALAHRIDTTGLHGEDDGVSRREIALGNETENRPLPGQMYYLDKGGPLTQEDYELMHQNRNWENAPTHFPISQEDGARYQPDSSAQAIERFDAMCKDNDVVSRAATWGTRRRSLPSISDIEGVTSGNFLKKLSLSRGDTRRPSILKELRCLVSKPASSQILKRGRSNQEDEVESSPDVKADARDSQTNRTPPSRTQSGKKTTPSVNTAIVMLGSNAASIATTHARSGSISASLTSPKSAFPSLSVKNTLRRPRSKTELPKESSQSNLADMWKRTGGPPVPQLPQLPKSTSFLDAEDDEEDDEEMYENDEMKQEANKAIDDITPNFAGFKQHVLKLSPLLATDNTHLVDRIAHQQTIRYKALLNSKLRHLQQTAIGRCTCGTLCVAQGGSAIIADTRGDARGVDPLSAQFDDGSDGDMTPLEGTITQESFPADIPMPPTSILPAEFECQLCYQPKKFQKPSDWTKHVHEDVQPFTCTWERCREPKIFKRKADWVRHENEGHRHLEWWTCAVDDCRHVCYRRDNFLQHLVREHKFPEPKVKTKAALKRNPQMDPTWQEVEKCHVETHVRPQEEPCRFCGKNFPTWKKLTVHLAKHMEQISLPVLRLVARKALDHDTIISPVHDPPPRASVPFPPVVAVKAEPPSYSTTPDVSQAPMMSHPGNNPLAFGMGQSAGGFVYTMVPQPPSFPQQPYYAGQPYDGLSPDLDASAQMEMEMPQVTQGYGNTNTHAYNNHSIPVTATGYMARQPHFISGPPGLEPFPAASMNALGLYDQPIPYGGAMVNSSVSGSEHITPQGSISPYNRSPHQGAAGFYPQ